MSGTVETGDADRRRRLAERIAAERRARAAPGSDAERAENEAALQAFLSRLSSGLGLDGAPSAAPRRAGPEGAVLPFQRPAAAERMPEPVPAPEMAPPPDPAALALADLAADLEAACDLDRLPGAGPGLIWALKRAGVRRLADLAALERDVLADRLGPIGRLVPLERWIGVARAAA